MEILKQEKDGCEDMAMIRSSGSIVADKISSLMDTIFKHCKMMPYLFNFHYLGNFGWKYQA